MRPNLKTAAAMIPASASAPAITINNIWIEPARLTDDESAAASGTAATTGGSAAAEFGCPFASESAVAGPATADELKPDGSGQREAISDGCVFVSREFAGWLFSMSAAFAGVRGQLVLLVASTRVCGKGNSARASAIVCGVVASFCGETGFANTGFADGAEPRGATRESFSRSSPRYQQWRLVA
jgi:hypothetical protein